MHKKLKNESKYLKNMKFFYEIDCDKLFKKCYNTNLYPSTICIINKNYN
jgi:hypothetical protein